jgi:hypothetical protein
MEYAPLYSSEAYTETHMNSQLDGGTWNKYLTDDYFGSNDPLTGTLNFRLEIEKTYVTLFFRADSRQSVGEHDRANNERSILC